MLQIGILGAVERVPRGRGAHRIDIALLGAVAAQHRPCLIAEQARPHAGRRHAHRRGISFVAVTSERQQRRLGAKRARRPIGLGIPIAERTEHRSAQIGRQQPPHPFLRRVEFVAAIAGKRLVRAIARQRDRHRFAGKLADPVGCERGGIGERLVERVDKPVDQHEVVRRDDARAMIGGEALGHRLGVAALVMVGLVEADRAGLHRALGAFRHQRDDGGAVHPAGEKRAQRHIRNEPRANRRAHPIEQFGLQRARRSLYAVGEIHVPPPARRWHRLAALDEQAVTRRQLPHAGDEAGIIGHIAERHEILDRADLGHATQQRMREQALQFGGEGERSV